MSSQSDNAIQFTFGGPNPLPDEASLRATIEALDPDSAPTAAPTAKPEATAAPAASTPADDAKVETPEAQAATALAAPTPEADLKTYEITVDGQKLTVTEADLKSGHMRLQDYTRKTQAVAARERELTAREQSYQTEITRLQGEQAQIDAFLRNQAAIEAYQRQAFGANQMQPPQLDPSRPPTAQEVAQIAAYNAEQVRLATVRETSDQLQAMRNELAQQARQAQETIVKERVGNEVDTHVAALVKRYPILSKVSEDVAEELIGEALKFGPPANMDEAKARLTQVAESRVARIQTLLKESQKQEAVAAAKLRQSSTEPPGGIPAKAPPGRKLSLDPRGRKDLIDAGIADVQAFLGQ